MMFQKWRCILRKKVFNIENVMYVWKGTMKYYKSVKFSSTTLHVLMHWNHHSSVAHNVLCICLGVMLHRFLYEESLSSSLVMLKMDAMHFILQNKPQNAPNSRFCAKLMTQTTNDNPRCATSHLADCKEYSVLP